MKSKSLEFSLIAAADSKGGIGKNGKLPWGLKLKTDLAFFHKTTKGSGHNAVIMGRTTWESIPKNYRPLSGRLNIILTHQKNYPRPATVLAVDSLEDGLRLCSTKGIEEIFVIGGAKVFEEAIGHPGCHTIHLTEVDGNFACDTFFPSMEGKPFKKVFESKTHRENGISYRFTRWIK